MHADVSFSVLVAAPHPNENTRRVLGLLYTNCALQWRHNEHDGVPTGITIVYSTVYSGADQRKH